MKLSWDDDIPNIWKVIIQSCSSHHQPGQLNHRPSGVHGPSALEGPRECDPTSAWSSLPPGLWHRVPPTGAWGELFHIVPPRHGEEKPTHYLVDLGGNGSNFLHYQPLPSAQTWLVFCWLENHLYNYQWGTVRLGHG